MLLAALVLTVLGDGVHAFSLAARLPQHTSSVRNGRRGLLGAPTSTHHPPGVQHVSASPAASAPTGLSDVSAWHRTRRRAILEAHPEVAKLETPDWKGVLLLLTCNAVLYACAAAAGSLPWLGVVALALTVGATASLWQLTMLHEVIHGTMVKNGGLLQSLLLWLGSFPSVFGYFLYLRFGHLSHHNRLGAHSMAELFSSPNDTFEDGDILFVTHRMNLSGPKGPYPPEGSWVADKLPDAPMNLAFNFFSDMWRKNEPYKNMLVYSLSMFLERLVLVVSDKVVAVTGKNTVFFPNKPAAFHRTAGNYARLATVFQAAVIYFFGWKAFVLLFISETAWSLPIHPGCAMFITNHGSSQQPAPSTSTTSTRIPPGLGAAGEGGGGCQPTRSTYAGLWYDIVCCNTNYHLEHHDFPNIPILELPKVRHMAPEFYDSSAVTSGTDLWKTVRDAFDEPDFYACMGASPDGLRLIASETNSQK